MDAVQPGWIAHAVMTDQLGFVIGFGISTGVQLSAYVRANGAIGTGRLRRDMNTRERDPERQLS